MSINDLGRPDFGSQIYQLGQRVASIEARFAVIESAQAGYDARLTALENDTPIPTPTPTPTPVPAFTVQPTITPASGTAGSTTFTATPGTASNGAITARAWLLNGTSISTGLTAAPMAAGTLTYQETATGDGGTAQSVVRTASVAAAPTPTPIPTPSPTISFANSTATVAEGSGTQTVTNTVNVVRDGAVGALTINLTYGGTATSGTDYVAGPTSLTIGAGVSSGSFDLTINGDTGVETDETIIINAALSGYSATASKTITITNDDAAALPRFSAATGQVRAGTGRAVWAQIGDSTTAAYTQMRSAAWGQQMREKFAAAGIACRADAVWGAALVANNGTVYSAYNPDFQNAGWAPQGVYGAGGEYFLASGPATFTPQATTNSFAFYHTQISDGGSVTVSDASGTLGVINGQGGGVIAKTVITRAVSSTSPITMTHDNNGRVFMDGIVPSDTNAPCLEIWNMGATGWQASDWLKDGSFFEPLNMLKFMAPEVHLFNIELGPNEAAAGVSTATYKANIQSLMTGIAAPSTRDLLLVHCHPGLNGSPYDMPTSYHDALDELSVANGLQPAIDFRTSGLVAGDYNDAIHLVASGYAKEATTASSYVISRI